MDERAQKLDAELARPDPTAAPLSSGRAGKAPAPDGSAGNPPGGPAQIDEIKRLSIRVSEAAHLYHIGVALASALDMVDLGVILRHELARLIDTSNFALAIHHPPSQSLTFPLVFSEGEQLEEFSLRLEGESSPLASVVRDKKPVLIRDWAKAPETQGRAPLWGRSTPGSWLAVPFPWQDEILGALVLQSERPGALTKHHLVLLTAVGKQVAPALKNVQLYQESQRRIRHLGILEEVGRALSSTLDLEEVLTRVMERINALLEVEAGSLLLVEEETGDLIFQIALGEKAEAVKPFRLKRGQGIAGQVALTGEPLLIANVQQDERHFKKTDVTTGFLTKSMLCVPMVARGRVIGVIQVMNKINGEFSDDDLDLLSAVANYGAIALENAMLHRNVRAERDRVIVAQEEVRRQLARDLHDGPTQLVAGMLMSLDFVRQALEHGQPDLAQGELQDMVELGQRATHQMRTLLFELRPLVLETQGLVPALEVFLERRQKDEATRLILDVKTDRPDGKLMRPAAKVEAALFAIAQEAVNNALKHAQANYIRVRLIEREGSLAMIVEDDGKGFELDTVMSNYEQRGSLGMVNVHERAEQIGGQLVMKSKPGHGTKITVWIPTLEKD